MRYRWLMMTMIILGGLLSLQAQESGSVNINITLHPVQILTVGQENVNIAFRNSEDYIQGVANLNEGHLTVFSTGGYEISVRAAVPGFEPTTGQEKEIPLNLLRIEALMPDGGIGSKNLSSVHLRDYHQNIISSSHADLGVSYDVMYEGLGGLALLEYVSNDLEVSTFTARVIYSIEIK